ncbi:2-phospho-L-lactate guanylyltransferase [Halobacterium wangiae]|uniref:2-phospho-L-lactate guanylyltransferase n=1 Tax=Halobacterium wangiae TaxID=2902623 RepID=UPI001E2E9A70|nr:2-phospho-L-lactate guanylyltransferase [Halobacterium wangiae]
MRVVVPFDPTEPNTRLSSVLTPEERREFADAMLADVLNAVQAAGGSPELLASAPVDVDAPVTVDDRSLSVAVNDALADGVPAAVVMADLALVTPGALADLFDADGDVVVAPGRGGGTNALVVREPAFQVDYHGVSYRDHVTAAEDVGASVATVDSFRLAVDIDERADLVDVLVHGDGAAAAWLRDAGFRVAVRDGQPVAVREPND